MFNKSLLIGLALGLVIGILVPSIPATIKSVTGV